MDLSLLISIAIPCITGGAAYGGVKVAMNGSRTRIVEIHADVKELRKEVNEEMHTIRANQYQLTERVARIEGRQ